MVPRMENENGMMRRPRGRFSAEEKARIVGLYEESGLTRAEFCRREGVSLFNLQRWLGKRRRSGEARFVEVEARAVAEQGRYRIGFGGEAWLEVEGGLNKGERSFPPKGCGDFHGGLVQQRVSFRAEPKRNFRVSRIHCYRPNQRARRLEPKCSLSARMATDGS